MTLPDEAMAHLQRVLREPDPPGDRYVLGEPLGQGGMGTVYRAHDRALGRDVALKVLRGDTADASGGVRLEREARILARLEHPGIVPVHDVGVLADGRVFYVMKLIDGEPLHAFARTAPLTDVLRVLLRVCETVGFAHAHGVVHRDLKPANIMVGAFGEVLVLDWGIARVLGAGRSRPEPAMDEGGLPLRRRPGSDAAGNSRDPAGQPSSATAASSAPVGAVPDTAPGTVLGTLGYMAPEQALGQPELVDARTDVFALGAILRAVATPGRGSAPRPLAAIWERALAPDRSARYASAADLAADIARFLDARPVSAHRETLGERAGRVFRKYQTAIILVLTYLAVRLLFLVMRRL